MRQLMILTGILGMLSCNVGNAAGSGVLPKLFKAVGRIVDSGSTLSLSDVLGKKLSLRGARIEEPNFAGIKLGGDFTEGDFYRGNFVETLIAENTSFRGASLYNSDFRWAYFEEGVDMREADVRWADFRRSNLEVVDLRGAIYNQHTKFPEGFSPDAAGMVYRS